MSEVLFQFENGAGPIRVSASSGAKLLDVARAANVAIDAPCSGNGACGKCRVKLLSGEVEGLQTGHISDEDYADGWRLSCASTVTEDLTVLVPDIASAYRSRMKTADLSSEQEMEFFRKAQTELIEAGLSFENDFTEIEVTMDEPTLEDTMPDTERLERAIQAAAGVSEVILPYCVVRKLPEVLRNAHFSVKAAGERKGDVFRVFDLTASTESLPIAGLAIDIGTTTVSAVIFNMKTGRLLAKGSGGNGQIRYGADVINRIIEQGRPGGVKRLQDAIVKETLVPLTEALCEQAAIPAERIVRVGIASNTTMNHLLLGADASPIRMEPYIPAFFRWDHLHARDIGLLANPDARVVLAPNIGSYVGGDITAGTLVSRIWDKDEFSLFIDLGTNGEIVFGNRDFMMSCACSAGPAFEGGDISCGMRATDGAIEAVTIDKETLVPTLNVIGAEDEKPVGLCGSGIIDVIAELYRTSAISSKGRFIREGERIVRDKHGIGRYILEVPEKSGTGREISITEVDIDSFIRAKGAIFSAIHTMLAAIDMEVDVIEHIYVAGGIGSGINMENAVRIGMFPDVDRSLFEYIGNSSLSGAYAVTESEDSEQKVHELSSNMTYMELSTNPQYMDEFVAACFLPHTDQSLFPSSVQE